MKTYEVKNKIGSCAYDIRTKAYAMWFIEVINRSGPYPVMVEWDNSTMEYHAYRMESK